MAKNTSQPMTMWPISTRVNKTENDDAGIIGNGAVVMVALPHSGVSSRLMLPILALALLLAGCTTPYGAPNHLLVGNWQSTKTLTLTTTEYALGPERGRWTAGDNDFRYKKAGGAQEQCSYTLHMSGKVLFLSDCRLAGRYTRMP
jgi:hypothetical protein